MSKKILPIRAAATGITVILSIVSLSSCGGERTAEPEERDRVLKVAEAARTQMMEQKRFLQRGFDVAPEIVDDADIITSDGSSFFFRSDSVIGSLDTLSAEFLFRLPSSDSVSEAHEAVMRLRNSEDSWVPVGLYIRPTAPDG